ncbi:MAG TPA: F0F1 ATP synthase subunit A [Anaerolineales bacterium]|nr:F0F1 ATP synthase subunit A [Anaerolineales bacterium]
MRRILLIIVSLAAVVLLCGPVQSFLYPQPFKSSYGAMPVVSLPAEALPIPWFGGERMTNTFFTTLLMDVLVLLLVGLGLRHARRGELAPPKGFVGNFVEALGETLANFTESVAGKRAKSIFPLVATIFFLVLVGNWFKLLPGAESIGFLETPHAASVPGYAPREVRLGPIVFYTVDGTRPVERAATEGEHAAEPTPTEAAGLCTSCNITPVIRGIATDLNFTLALALITMAIVQAYGIRSQGGRYLFKFFNFPALAKGPMGIIEFFAGVLEIISEVSRIISFAFRLLGNIFAGTVLIFVISSLVPFIAPSIFYGLELFIGLIQAAVFALLAMIFINMATVSHSGEHAAHDEPAAAH